MERAERRLSQLQSHSKSTAQLGPRHRPEIRKLPPAPRMGKVRPRARRGFPGITCWAFQVSSRPSLPVTVETKLESDPQPRGPCCRGRGGLQAGRGEVVLGPEPSLCESAPAGAGRRP